jgi:hypothetical protein
MELGTRFSAIPQQESKLPLINCSQAMGVNRQPAIEAGFPNPAEQVVALLEACRGDISEAQLLAAINVKSARNEGDRDYWSRVSVLISNRAD